MTYPRIHLRSLRIKKVFLVLWDIDGLSCKLIQMLCPLYASVLQGYDQWNLWAIGKVVVCPRVVFVVKKEEKTKG